MSFQLPHTTIRILLNHFKWDKEKLMERYYDSDQEQLYAEARVVNPYRKSVSLPKKVKTENMQLVMSSEIFFIGSNFDFSFFQSRRSTGTEECEICYMILPSSVSHFYLWKYLTDLPHDSSTFFIHR